LVSTRQYSAFVTAGGYSHRTLWTESGWDWRQAFGVDGPLSVPHPFDIANHPRIGITWYEAIAYARWVSERHEELGVSSRVRLPTESELERAIRGDLGNRFAHGNQVDYTRCNGGGTRIGTTSAVGVFPGGRSPHGLYDATGNVWEWTLSTVEDEWGADLDGDAGRVTRGGAWNSYGNYLRAAFRYAFAPLTRNLVIGVRLAADSRD
jgi:formylglycine-generating enzyme required for sulfatase activity